MIPVDHDRRFGGLVRLHGKRGAEEIFKAHVVVVGVGGVGSWSAEALARSGVGRITLVDMDHVSESNINRQIHSLSSTLGKAKVQAMRERMMDIHPQCKIHVIDDFVTPENWSDLVAKLESFAPIQGLIDACDQVLAKTALAAWGLAQKQCAFITVGAAGGRQHAERAALDDLARVTHDSLLAKVRYNLRRRHGCAREGKLGVPCVYSTESIHASHSNESSDGTLNCHGFGSSVSVTATFGFTAAGWVINSLANSAKEAL